MIKTHQPTLNVNKVSECIKKAANPKGGSPWTSLQRSRLSPQCLCHVTCIALLVRNHVHILAELQKNSCVQFPRLQPTNLLNILTVNDFSVVFISVKIQPTWAVAQEKKHSL
ncbi:hypothetical protein ABVT39_003546 [Epinephelus coioides]